MQVRLRTILLCCVALGVFLRVLAVFVQAVPGVDAAYYAAMGSSFASGKEFTDPWVCCTSGGIYGPQLSHHFAPLWPMVLAAGYLVAGFSIATTMATSLLVSLLLILVVFLTTRDLLGVEKAWIVTAVVSLNFTLIQLTGEAYSENLLTIFYVATIWAILRSLKDDRYVVLAGLFAGIGYLTKAGIGYFFLLAGAMGFLWRFYYMRWNVFRNRYYLTAIAIFITFVGTWALRNILDFGWPHWETSPYDGWVVGYAFSTPLQFIPVLGAKVVLFFIFFATLGLFFAPQILRGFKRWREEDVSALLLAVTLPAILGIIFAASYTLVESWARLLWEEQIRYIVMAFVPLLWLALREESVPVGFHLQLPSLRHFQFPSAKSVLLRLLLVAVAGFAFYEVDRMIGLLLLFGALLAPRAQRIRSTVIVGLALALALTSVNSATTVARASEYGVAQFLVSVAHDGDIVALVGGEGAGLIYMYPYLAEHHIIFVEWNGTGNGPGAEFILTPQAGNYTGYRLLATFNWTKSPGLVDSTYFWLSKTIRSILGVPIRPGPPPTVSPGELFLYQSVI